MNVEHLETLLLFLFRSNNAIIVKKESIHQNDSTHLTAVERYLTTRIRTTCECLFNNIGDNLASWRILDLQAFETVGGFTNEGATMEMVVQPGVMQILEHADPAQMQT